MRLSRTQRYIDGRWSFIFDFVALVMRAFLMEQTMANGRSIKFNGSKVQIQKIIDAASAATVAITGLTATNPATVKTTLNAKKGDIITLTGLDGFEGDYVVSAVDSGTLTLANTDWSGKTVPSSFTSAKVGLVQFFDNFCELKNFQKSGATVEQIDVSTICSTDGKDYESGDREEGSLSMQFFMKPSSPVQTALEQYEYSGDKFWVRMLLSDGSGTYIFRGSIETGLNIDGQVAGRWESGVSMKLSGRRYFVGA